MELFSALVSLGRAMENVTCFEDNINTLGIRVKCAVNFNSEKKVCLGYQKFRKHCCICSVT